MNSLRNYYFLKYKSDVFRFVLSIVKDPYLAEDILQETFLKLWENYNNIRDPSKIKYWLFTTARNISITYLNKTDRLTAFDDISFEKQSADGNFGFFELISCLSVEEQQLVSLRIIGKFKWKEIAKSLGLSEESAKKRYQRILNKIKNQLEERTS